MAETSGQTATQPAARLLEGLLTTKLNLPRVPPGFVSRPRLADLLDDGLAREVTLVCAPAGFGKTALLADWCRRRERRVAWLSLDTGDNDPVRFWRHAIAALDGVLPGISDRVAPVLGTSESAFRDGVTTAVINELAAQPADVLLVLDDYHLVEAEPVHASLSFLLENLPSGLHVVLASRADPPLPLPRLRAGGKLAELREAELRFTRDEAAALLAEEVGSDLGIDAITALTARTEGWAAGLQLAGLSLKGRSDAAALVEAFSGSHRYILDYLTQEVLEHQPEHIRDFLIETSILERLSGPLCDAVTGRTDGQEMLEAIEQANLFLVPLDEARGWWRYHHLFADLLRMRLQRQRHGRVAELHRNSAAWHERHGRVEDAIHHAIAAGEDVWAARLVERSFDALYLGSQGATVQRWLAQLPPDLCESRPRLLLAQVWLSLFGGRLDGVSDRLDAAERATAAAADETFEPSVGTQASWLANIPAAIAVARADVAHWRGDGEQTILFSTRALDELDEDEWLLSCDAHAHLSAGKWLCGHVAAAERDADSTFTRFRAAGAVEMAAVWAGYYFGAIQRAQGRLDAALKTYQQALDLVISPDGVPLPVAGVQYVGKAEVAFQRNDLDTAVDELTEALPLCRQFVSTQALATGLATLAWIQHARGDDERARATMVDASEATGGDVTDLINPVPALQARLLLAQGDVDAAARWVAGRGIGPDDEPTFSREPAYLVLARVLIARNQAGSALTLLDRLHKAAVGQQRFGSLIEIQALRAVAVAAGGDEPAAVAALVEALTLAQPQGYIRVFVDEGPSMWALLGRVVAVQRNEPGAVSLEYLGRLVRACENRPAGATAGRNVVPGLIAQLSERELEVLGMVAAGKPNQQIADELFVSLSTVKKHVTHIFDKLGAANRTEATARARELGLL